MASFVFQLEGVLRHRQQVERQRQRGLAEVQLRMTDMQRELGDLDRRQQEATAELRGGKLVGTVDLAYLAAHRRFVAAVSRQAMALVQRMALLQRELDERRAALAAAARDRKIIEKLRERQHERWRREQARREALQLDEISTQLAFDNLAEGSRP